nr:glycosyltransferase [Solirubrobacterales bacterium]
MPTLSFVLVVHREQAHLEGCVASLLDQPFGDVELLAIDDASPDHGPRLLDELAGRHARMRVIHLP